MLTDIYSFMHCFIQIAHHYPATVASGSLSISGSLPDITVQVATYSLTVLQGDPRDLSPYMRKTQ